MPNKTFRLTSHLSPLTCHFSRLTSHLSRFTSHGGFRRYFANTSWLFAEQILRMIAGFLVGVWVARYLGPEKYGIFNYSAAFVAIFAGVAKLGLDGIVVRDLVKEPEKKDLYLGTAFWLKLFGAVAALILIATGTLFTNNDRTTNIYIFIIASGIFFQSFEVVDFYFQSKVLSKFVSVCRITQLILSSLLKIYFVLTKADLIYFVLVSLIDQITLALTLFLSYSHYHKHNEPQKNWLHFLSPKTFDIHIAKNLLKDSWPLILSSIFIGIYRRIDQTFLQNILGSKEVGIYTASLKLVEIWYFIPVILNTSLYPALVNAYKTNYELYVKRLEKLYMLFCGIFLFVSILNSIFSKQIITFIYGSKYFEASKVLPILTWSGIAVSLEVITGSALRVENKTKYVLYSTMWGAIVSIFLNPIFIRHFGINGASYTFLLSSIIASVIFLSFYKETRNLFFIALKSIFFG